MLGEGAQLFSEIEGSQSQKVDFSKLIERILKKFGQSVEYGLLLASPKFYRNVPLQTEEISSTTTRSKPETWETNATVADQTRAEK